MANEPLKKHEGENLENIRSILFGAQVEEIHQRIAALESQLRHETETLQHSMEALQQENNARHQKVMDEIKTLHELMHQNRVALTEEFSERMNQSDQALAEIREAVQTASVNRQELSALLSDMATYLSARTD